VETRENLWLKIIIGIGLVICLEMEGRTIPSLHKNAHQKEMNQWVDSIFNTMTLDEKIGQLFMITVDPSPSSRTYILKNINEQKIGGILFSKGTIREEAESINFYQKNSRIPLFIALDGEWGLSMRLEDTPLFPKNMMLGAIQNNEWIEAYGEEVGRECRELGVQINFAPVLDVNVNPANPVIGYRSFGENQRLVSSKGIAYAKGLENKNIIAVGKHFPGHGDTSTDSHYTLPQINHNRTRLDSIELYPFAEYIRAGFSGIMTGHLSVPELDNANALPASLSNKIVTDLLSDELGFDGLKFTDALVMKGATGGNYSVCVKSLLAGNDILLSPDKLSAEFASVKKAVETGLISLKTIKEKCMKILRYKYITELDKYKSINEKGLKERLNTDYTDWLIQKLNAEAITLLKNKNNSIPLKQLGTKKTAVVSLGGNLSDSFQQTMTLYGDFDFFSLAVGANPNSLFTRLKKYDAIVCAIHSPKIDDSALQLLAAQKEVHLCFFITPYQLKNYKQSISAAQSVTLGYENTEYAQKAVAEVIMGGLPAKGKLPVSIAGLFQYGTGLSTPCVRLSYQHPYEVKMSQTVLNGITDIVNEGIEKKAFPGCQIFIAKDGVVVYNQSFGYFDYAHTHPVQNSDIYDLASITKATATLSALMKLYDEGKYKLQDKISRYVPELRKTDKENITIENILFHQSGLPSFYPFYQLLIDSTTYTGPLYSKKRNFTYRILYDKNTYMRTDFKFFTNMVSRLPQKGIQKQAAENFYLKDDIDRDIIKKISELPLRSNSNYTYSDLNFILLKEMIENISNTPLDLYVEKEFFADLGAISTTFLPLRKFARTRIAPTENDEFLRNQILIGYPHDETAALMGGVSGNAGLFSNANDLAKLLQMFLNNGEYGGERYLSEYTVKLFTTTKSTNSRRGLGFDKPDKEKETGSTSEKAPANSYGHTGYTGTCFWIDPDNQLIYIFLSNRTYPSRTYTRLMELNIRPRIQNIIYESINN
jgi:beta-glucosidase-like glycosyl hydrolase/CubicO group peptidase (beta-lactamase class C family)